MATTPNFALPYPVDADAPDGPLQLGNLATAVDTELNRLVGVGSAAWTAFTPTWTGVTVGDGTSDCAYIKRGRLVVVRYKFTLGSTSAITATPQPTLPVTAVAGAATAAAAMAVYRDVSLPGNFFGIIHVASTSVAQFTQLARANPTDASVGVTSTVPFTWAVGDTIGGVISYEASS